MIMRTVFATLLKSLRMAKLLGHGVMFVGNREQVELPTSSLGYIGSTKESSP